MAFTRTFSAFEFVSAFEIDAGRGLHSFFGMDDGSCLAFFEVPGRPFDFKRQDTLEHIALGVEPNVTACWRRPGRRGLKCEGRLIMGSSGQSTCGDPNGYVVELTARGRQEIMYPAISKPHEVLAGWQAAKDGAWSRP